MPEGPGGDRPNEVGNEMKCERCREMYLVSRTPEKEECVYHWGRPFRRKVDGEFYYLIILLYVANAKWTKYYRHERGGI
jgi:hypothetical protein